MKQAPKDTSYLYIAGTEIEVSAEPHDENAASAEPCPPGDLTPRKETAPACKNGGRPERKS